MNYAKFAIEVLASIGAAVVIMLLISILQGNFHVTFS